MPVGAEGRRYFVNRAALAGDLSPVSSRTNNCGSTLYEGSQTRRPAVVYVTLNHTPYPALRTSLLKSRDDGGDR